MFRFWKREKSLAPARNLINIPQFSSLHCTDYATLAPVAKRKQLIFQIYQMSNYLRMTALKYCFIVKVYIMFLKSSLNMEVLLTLHNHNSLFIKARLIASTLTCIIYNGEEMTFCHTISVFRCNLTEMLHSKTAGLFSHQVNMWKSIQS
jgi:hypothetical protein